LFNFGRPITLSTAAPEEFSFADIDSGATDLATYEWEGPYQLNVPIQNPSKWQNWLFAINSSHSWRHCIITIYLNKKQ